MSIEHIAELADVHKRFGNIVALDGLNLGVRQGELLAVLGANGAGKTTAISLLLGLAQPDSGSVQLFGQLPRVLDARRRIGVMMQQAVMPPELRVREVIALCSSYYPDPLTEADTLQMTGLEPLAERFYGKLSGGEKRQVQFAAAICGRPQLLFLDEPTVGLDIQARELMWAALRRLISSGRSIVLTTHYLEEAEALSDRVVVLAKGRAIAAGSVNDLRALVSRKRIRCNTALDMEQIRSWPDVEEVQRERELVLISTRNAEAVVRQLLAADGGLQDLEVQRAGLSEAFTELTEAA